MKINEKGRSMIEMLGVLAIIGVLSVGGIAGYSKAMAKFRANNTIDQVSHIVANVRILFGSQKTYHDLGESDATTYDIVTKAALLPDEMKTGAAEDMTAFTNAYSGTVTLKYAQRFANEAVDREGAYSKAFIIELGSIPQDACVDLASQDWNSSSGTGLIAFAVNNSDAVAGAYQDTCVSANASGNTQGSGALTCVSDMPMTVGNAASSCNGSDNTLSFKFY